MQAKLQAIPCSTQTSAWLNHLRVHDAGYLRKICPERVPGPEPGAFVITHEGIVPSVPA